MQSRIKTMTKKREKYYRQFKNTFGIPLADFFDNLFGFDVVGFDDWLGTPDGISMRDHIISEYGQEAVDIVLELL